MSTMRYARVVSVRRRTPAECRASDPHFIYVGRAMPWQKWQASLFANPFSVKHYPDAAWRFAACLDSVLGRGEWPKAIITPTPPLIRHFVEIASQLHRLQGATLGCWCTDWSPGRPDDAAATCHAVILARIVNARFGPVVEWTEAVPCTTLNRS